MTECQQAIKLSAYHDGEMSAADRAEFDRHLRQCPQCADELARLGKLAGLLGAAPRPELSAPALNRLHRAVDRLPARGILRMAEALSALAASVLLACIIGLANRSPAREPAAMPVWETTAVAQQPAEASVGGSDELLATWIAQDLSSKSEQ